MARLKDPQETALLRAINASETKQHEQAARLVMADWCEEHGQLRRAKWFRGTAELCVVYPQIAFMRRVGVVVTGFLDWFDEVVTNKFWRDSAAASGGFTVPMMGYMAGPVIASMVELRRVVVTLPVQLADALNLSSQFRLLLRDDCREVGVGWQVNTLASVWARKVASNKAKLRKLVSMMHMYGKPLPAKFKPLPTV